MLIALFIQMANLLFMFSNNSEYAKLINGVERGGTYFCGFGRMNGFLSRRKFNQFFYAYCCNASLKTVSNVACIVGYR